MMSKDSFERIREDLIGYLVQKGAAKDEAEDITQHVLLKAYEKQFKQIGSVTFRPYLRRMAKNHFIDNRRRWQPTLMEDAEIMKMADFLPDSIEDKALLKKVSDCLEGHKYGYIIYEMKKRNLKKIKELAPYTNEKAKTLYKRYQRLIKDLKEELKKGGGMTYKNLTLNILRRNCPIFRVFSFIE